MSSLRLLEPSDAELGRVGENLAARHLRRKGMRVVARRLRTHAAEIDLLLRDGDGWACVEVKTGRVGPRFRPGGRVDARGLERLRIAARIIARRTGRAARVDLVEVLLDRNGGLSGVVHHRGIRDPLDSGHSPRVVAPPCR